MLNVHFVDMSDQQQLMFWVAVLWLCPRIAILIDMTKFWAVLSNLLAEVNSIYIYADIPGKQVSLRNGSFFINGNFFLPR